MTLDAVESSLINHIVVPFDDSGYSERAIKFATMMAKKFDSKITILTILYSHILGSSFLGMEHHHTVIEKTRLEKLNEKFRSFENAGKKLNILIESVVQFSPSVASSILSFSSSKKADLIVMGTRGKGSAPSYMRIGSVAIDVSQVSQKPVILIK